MGGDSKGLPPIFFGENMTRINFTDYQKRARETAIYPMAHKVTYPILGATGELGELANKYKKVLRGDVAFLNMADAKKEIGDVLWYLSNIASDMNFSLQEIAELNLEKLASRAERGVIKGSGDDR